MNATRAIRLGLRSRGFQRGTPGHEMLQVKVWKKVRIPLQQLAFKISADTETNNANNVWFLLEPEGNAFGPLFVLSTAKLFFHVFSKSQTGMIPRSSHAETPVFVGD